MILLLIACSLSRVDLDGDGYTVSDGDCNDHDHDIHPGAQELEIWYDDVDQNCDGRDDDADGDGYCVVPAPKAVDCDSGEMDCKEYCLKEGVDCDDTNPTIYPGADERCDHAGDDDCDGEVDEADAVDIAGWYLDMDGDGWGGTEAASCDDLADDRRVDVGGDCEDGTDPDDGVEDTAIHPEAEEQCSDGVDQDCDGTANGCDLRGEFSPADDGVLDITLWERAGYAVAWCPTLGGAGAPGIATGKEPGETVIITGDFRADVSSLRQARFSPGITVPDSGNDESGYAVACVGDTTGGGGGVVAIAEEHAYDDDGRVWLVDPQVADALTEADALAVLVGTGALRFGASISGGDFDGDGVDDLVVGAVNYCDACGSRQQGATFLFSGPVSGTLSPAEASTTLVGEEMGDASGNAVANAGDIDGDGLNDLVVGALNHQGPGNDAGAVYLVAGPAGDSMTLADADARVVGSGDSAYFGFSVAGAGDWDADGYRDVVVGAYGADHDDRNHCGATYVIRGPMDIEDVANAAATIYGEAESGFLGWSVAGGADVDADGYDDVLAGAYAAGNDEESLTGRAALLHGPDSGTFTVGETDGRFFGEHAFDQLGRGTALGDLDADGYGDVILSADAAGDDVIIEVSIGSAYVFFGGGM